MARGTAPHLPRRRARRRQDLRHAQRGPAPPRAGHRRRRRLVETHGRREHGRAARRPRGRPAAHDRVPRQRRSRRWTSTPSSPADPQVALVDELAHTNVPGSRNEKRWQDVDELLDAGIDVISTVNIQHLESLNDVVERITGIAQRETIPDAIVRAGRAGRARRHDARGAAAAHGPRQHLPGRADRRRARQLLPARQPRRPPRARAAVGRRPGRRRRSRTTASATASTRPWETRERVVVAITGAPGGEHLIRRAARIAQRAHGELSACTSRVERRPARRRRRRAARRAPRSCSSELGGEYHEVVGADVAAALVDVRPGRERDAARPRGEPPIAVDRAHARLGHQPGHPAVRADRRARDLAASEAERAGARPTRPRRRVHAGAAAAAPARRLGSSPSVGLPLLTRVAGAAPRRTSACRACCCSTCWSWSSSPRSAGCARRWSPAVAGVPARELVLHAARSTRSRSPRPRTCSRWSSSSSSAVIVSVLVDRRRRGARSRRRAPRAEAEALARLGGALVGDDDPLPGADGDACATTFGARRRVAVLRRERRRVGGRGGGGRRRCRSGPRTATLSVAARRRRGARRCAGRRSPAEDRRLLQRVRAASSRWRSSSAQLRAEAAVAGGARPRPTSCAPRCCRRCRTTCARRWRRSRPRSRACCQHDVDVDARRHRRSSSTRSTRRPTGSTRSSATCST